MPSLEIHHTTRAPAQMAGWLRGLLDPAAKAAGITKPPPMEVRGCGGWGGYFDHACNPDGRVCVSGITLFSRRAVVRTYLHEAAHALLAAAGEPNCSHDPRFFALQYFLFWGLDNAQFMAGTNKTAWCLSPSFYDLQDSPISNLDGSPMPTEEWFGASLDWSISTAKRLCADGMNAEQAARAIIHEYPNFQQKMVDAPKKIQLATDLFRQLQGDVKTAKNELKIQNALWRKLNLQTMFFGGLGWFLLVLLGLKSWL